MSNDSQGQVFLSLGIYFGIAIMLGFLIDSFKHSKWLQFILMFVSLAWVGGGFIISQSIAYDGIDTKDKTTRYILIFTAILLFIIFIFYERSDVDTYFN